MSAPAKIGVFVVSLLVVLAVALTVLVKTQVTPEKVRNKLLPLIEESLGRDVDFGTVSIGVFSGISVADLKVMQKGDDSHFFSVKLAELSYQLWPLLTGKVVIDQVLLDQPKIHLTRLSDGQFNISDLLPEVTANKSSNPSHKVEKSSSSTVFSLLVKEVNLKSGELHYVDKYKNAKTPFRYSLDDFNFKARQITFEEPFPVDLSAVVNGSHIDISGEYDLLHKSGDLVVHLAPLDLVQFAPYYRDSLPGKVGSGRLGLTLEVNASPEGISSKGKVSLEGIDLVLDQYPDAGLDNAQLGVDYAVTYSVEKELLEVSTLLLSFNKLNFGAEGEFDLSDPDPYLVFKILLKDLDLRDVMQNLPEGVSRDLQKYSFAGLIDGQVDLSGRLSRGADLLKTASLSLTDVRGSAENLRAGVSGEINYADKIVKTEDLLLQYGDQQARLTLDAQLLADNSLKGDYNLSANTLDLNKILPENSLNSESLDQENGQSDTGVERRKTLADDIGPFSIPADLSGTLSIDRMIYKDLNVDKIKADLILRDNRLSIKKLTSNIGGGEFSASAVVNLGVKGLAYQGQMAMSQPNLATLISGLLPVAKQSLSGQLAWQNNFSGRGTIMDNILQRMQLKGDFNLQNGEAKGASLVEGIAEFIGSPELKVLSFENFSGQYDLRDGLARINSSLHSSKTKLKATGSMTVGGGLNLSLDTRLAPAVLEKLGRKENIRKMTTDNDGWDHLPLRIKGSLSEPKVSYDSDALQNQMVDKAKGEASRKLLEKIAPGEGEEVEPIKQMLDNTLDKLFGK